MSFNAAAAVWKLDKDLPLNDGDLIVLIALADLANDEDFTCYPSVKELSKKCRTSESTVKRRLTKLEAMNLISRQRIRNNSGQLGKYIHCLNFL